ncbi:efflux RND transporter periplasmic adaptor subunit [Cohnella sp. REN36]|uniref:efflux RND transporter periplasmic adaptor subunit n=1 Tax=Cohnella sp. REN36 TaxID=2887347 RepID=UPI001D13502B|nr:efflux RND transporter periplasmic adaptor subunit [Cohnella sp. REN36]MCC3371506.1 efflux RND transporter periplasmic adaptor subunit [Cohnella sp. REN36]
MEEAQAEARKRKMRRLAGWLACLLVVLTLTGNTVQSLLLPKAYAAQASKGRLEHRYRGTATVRPAEEIDLPNPAGWKVKEVLAGMGDRVKRGQVLVRYDDKEAAIQLSEQKAALKKLELSVQTLQAQYRQAVADGDDAARKAAESGMASVKLDMDSQKLRIAQLDDGIREQRQLIAPFDGVVVAVNATVGLSAANGPDVRLTLAEKGYSAELQMPADLASRLSVGEPIDLRRIERDGETLRGMIARIEDAFEANRQAADGSDLPPTEAPGVKVVVALPDKSVHGGERVQVDLTIDGASEQVLVPKQAVHRDASGSFVYTLKEDQGPLGNAYYAVRSPVAVTDVNEWMAAVGEGLFDGQEIIVDCKEPLQDGMRVRL